MAESHPEREVLQEFLLGRLDPEQTREVVRHLLTGCATCRKTAESLWLGQSASTAPSFADEGRSSSLSKVLDRVRSREASLKRERADAPRLAAELANHPTARQIVLVRNSSRYQTWSLCEQLLEIGWEARFDDIATTERCSEVAVAVAEVLDHDYYGLALVNDIKARAWGHLANAHRIRGDLRAAEEELRVAEELLRNGTGDPIELGKLLLFKYGLRERQGRFDEAIRLCERRIALYKRYEDSELLAYALLDKAVAHAHQDEIEIAIDLLHEALALVDPVTHPRQVLAIRHNLVYYLMDTGQVGEAKALLEETRPLYAELGDRLNLLRLRRLEGEIAAELGQVNVAEAAYLEARNGFIAEGIGMEAAEVVLALAALYLKSGRTEETRRLASQLVPIYQAQNLHQEAMEALLLFQKAAMAESITTEMVFEILAFLEKAKNDPTATFRPRSQPTDG